MGTFHPEMLFKNYSLKTAVYNQLVRMIIYCTPTYFRILYNDHNNPSSKCYYSDTVHKKTHSMIISKMLQLLINKVSSKNSSSSTTSLFIIQYNESFIKMYCQLEDII
jgi:hypothetical protein